MLLLLFFATSFAQDSIIDLLPDPMALPGIQLAGEQEIYYGEDLFDLMNGGAEIYLEYGFVKVVAQNYSELKGNTSLRVEIYEMNDPEAAYGIFALTAMGKNIQDKITYYIVSDLDYGMMVKGNYFIIASFGNLNKDFKKNILQRIAEELNFKIKPYAEFPRLLTDNPSPCTDFLQSLYFRGNLALRNLIYLDFKLPFKFSEGIAYKCPTFEYTLFVPDNEKSLEVVAEETISIILEKNPDWVVHQSKYGYSIVENSYTRFEVIPENKGLAIIKYY